MKERHGKIRTLPPGSGLSSSPYKGFWNSFRASVSDWNTFVGPNYSIHQDENGNESVKRKAFQAEKKKSNDDIEAILYYLRRFSGQIGSSIHTPNHLDIHQHLMQQHQQKLPSHDLLPMPDNGLYLNGGDDSANVMNEPNILVNDNSIIDEDDRSDGSNKRRRVSFEGSSLHKQQPDILPASTFSPIPITSTVSPYPVNGVHTIAVTTVEHLLAEKTSVGCRQRQQTNSSSSSSSSTQSVRSAKTRSSISSASSSSPSTALNAPRSDAISDLHADPSSNGSDDFLTIAGYNNVLNSCGSKPEINSYTDNTDNESGKSAFPMVGTDHHLILDRLNLLATQQERLDFTLNSLKKEVSELNAIGASNKTTLDQILVLLNQRF